ncbi:MAG: M15 family metallopeptidase [Bacteroidota bacterium]
MKITFFLPISTLLVLLFSTNCSPSTPEEQQAPALAEVPAEASVAETPRDTTPQLTFSLDYIRGRFDPAKHPDFTKVDPDLTDRDGSYYMRKDAYAAFVAMHTAAKADGIHLEIISATRNFERQKSIWEAKWNGARLLEGREKAPEVYPDPKDRALAILRWSSMPGTSRHHWGTDVDFNKLTNSYFESGQGLAEYEWLTAHAHAYGFCRPYSAKGDDRPHGYNEEKWHWSYLPVAQQLTDLARTALTDEQIDGFAGAEVAPEIGVVEKYVLGISSACQP